MKKLIVLISSILSIFAVSAQASPSVDKHLDNLKESVRISPIENTMDFDSLAKATSTEQLQLPVEQLSKDFNSLLKQNGSSNRENVFFDEQEVDLKADLESDQLENQTESKL